MDQWPNQNGDPAIYGNKWQQQHKAPTTVGHSKSSLKRKVYSNSDIFKEGRIITMNGLMSQLLKLEKEEQMRPKVSRGRDIIKIREEINKI